MGAGVAVGAGVDGFAVGDRVISRHSPGSFCTLANAKAANADPGIRARLNADQRAAIQNSDRSFTDRLLASPVSPDNGKPVNADAEVNKGRKTSTPKKEESGGWFDWL